MLSKTYTFTLRNSLLLPYVFNVLVQICTDRPWFLFTKLFWEYEKFSDNQKEYENEKLW